VQGWDALNLLSTPVRRRKGGQVGPPACGVCWSLWHVLRCVTQAPGVLTTNHGCSKPWPLDVLDIDERNCRPAPHAPAPRSPRQKVDRRLEPGGGGGNKRERCVGVESYWRQLDPGQRRQLLRVPVARMAEGGWPAAGRPPTAFFLRGLRCPSAPQTLASASGQLPASCRMPCHATPALRVCCSCAGGAGGGGPAGAGRGAGPAAPAGRAVRGVLALPLLRLPHAGRVRLCAPPASVPRGGAVRSRRRCGTVHKVPERGAGPAWV
jgi:hypothetical protein